MLVVATGANLANVWKESFTDRNGELVEFYKAQVSVIGEAPVFVSVAKENADELTQKIGQTGNAVLDVTCAGSRERARVFLRGLE